MGAAVRGKERDPPVKRGKETNLYPKEKEIVSRKPVE